MRFPGVGSSLYFTILLMTRSSSHALTTTEWLADALTANGQNPESKVRRKEPGQSSSSSNDPSWVADGERLAYRLRDLAAISNRSRAHFAAAPWPDGAAVEATSAQSNVFSELAERRCRQLTRPTTPPLARAPIAVALSGQLRTAELTLPFLEELVIRASLPTPVHIFGHLWALKSASNERALARLRQMNGLKALVVEDEASWESIVKAFMDGLYGRGFIDLQSNYGKQKGFWKTSHGAFLSQWYKVTQAHSLVRRYYADEQRQQRLVSPSVILRLRPDHLLHVRWNLTAAALEFRSRAAAEAANGNFLALWGPPSAKQFCGATMCAGGRPRSFATAAGQASSPRNCWSNGRFDDGFAFGTPAAFDVYAAAYHPYTKNCCENYVTGILPLGNLVPVGAAQSAGVGFFGSPDMPGSCSHRMGHLPMAEAPLADPMSVPGDGSCGPKDRCVLSDAVTDGSEHRGSFLQYLQMAADEEEGDSTDSDGVSTTTTTTTTTMAMAMTTTRSDNRESGNATAAAVAAAAAAAAEAHRLKVLPMGDMGNMLELRNFAGLPFDQLCAPVFYFNKHGVQILRYHDATEIAAEARASLRRDGACPPLLLRKPRAKKTTATVSGGVSPGNGGGGKGGGGNGGGGDGGGDGGGGGADVGGDGDGGGGGDDGGTDLSARVDFTECVDSRRPRYSLHRTMAPQLFPTEGLRCECSSPVSLDLDLEAADAALGAHCFEAGEFEKGAEARRGACDKWKRRRSTTAMSTAAAAPAAVAGSSEEGG